MVLLLHVDDLEAGTYLVNVVQTVPEIGDVDFTVSVDITILGCTDSGAANYNAVATVDDGSCEYIYGCTDMIAENYNPDATNDDGSCEYISGCTDASAINYNPAATQDDGSCDYVQCLQTAALLTLNTASWGSEVSFSINDVNNQVLAALPQQEGELLSNDSEYTIDLCLSDANSYTAILNDSYGDGWNGGTFSITTCDGSLIAVEGGLLAGSADTIAFTVQDCDTYLFGCTDSLASNFDSSANTDDGSCIYPGCTNPNYLEYDENANEDDGSCATIEVLGCTDETAPNYNADANLDDGSCQLPIECAEGLVGFEISMEDSYGDGWNGNVYSLINAAGETLDGVTGGLTNACPDYDEVSNPWAHVRNLNQVLMFTVLPAGCYIVTVGGGSHITETSWSLLHHIMVYL